MSDEVRILRPCPDCDAAPGALHVPGCDQEPCPRCGEQLLICTCVYEIAGLDPERLETDHPEIYRGGPTPEMEATWYATWGPRRIRWTGEPHGAAECRAYGFWALPTPAGPVPMPAGTPGAEEDFESMLQACQWDPRAQRFVLPADREPPNVTATTAPASLTRSRVDAGRRPTAGQVTVGRIVSSERRIVDEKTAGHDIGISITIVDERTQEREACGRLVQRRSYDGYQLSLTRGDRGAWWVLAAHEGARGAVWLRFAPGADHEQDRAWCEEHARRCFEKITRAEIDLAFSVPVRRGEA